MQCEHCTFFKQEFRCYRALNSHLGDGIHTIQQTQKTQTIDVTNHFLHVSSHGLDTAAQSIVQGDNLGVPLYPEPYEKKTVSILFLFEGN